MQTCVDACVDIFVDICADMCVNMRVDMCVDMCVNMCIDMRVNMCVDMCVDMCVAMCADVCVVRSHVCNHVCRHVCRSVCRNVCSHVQRCVFRHVCKYVCSRVCRCVCSHVCTHSATHLPTRDPFGCTLARSGRHWQRQGWIKIHSIQVCKGTTVKGTKGNEVRWAQHGHQDIYYTLWQPSATRPVSHPLDMTLPGLDTSDSLRPTLTEVAPGAKSAHTPVSAVSHVPNGRPSVCTVR